MNAARKIKTETENDFEQTFGVNNLRSLNIDPELIEDENQEQSRAETRIKLLSSFQDSYLSDNSRGSKNPLSSELSKNIPTKQNIIDSGKTRSPQAFQNNNNRQQNQQKAVEQRMILDEINKKILHEELAIETQKCILDVERKLNDYLQKRLLQYTENGVEKGQKKALKNGALKQLVRNYIKETGTFLDSVEGMMQALSSPPQS